MIAALVGLMGIIAGALLGGVVQSWSDRRARRVNAMAIIRLIVLELESAKITINAVATDGRWWQVNIPTHTWDDKSNQIAFDLDGNVLEELYNSVAIIKSLNSVAEGIRSDETIKAAANFDILENNHPVNPHALVISGAERERIARNALKVGKAAESLRRNGERLAQRRRAERIRTRAAISVFAVFALLASFILSTQNIPDNSELAISSAAYEALGRESLVDCDESGDDWTCEILPKDSKCGGSPSSEATDSVNLELAQNVASISGEISLPPDSILAQLGDFPCTVQAPRSAEVFTSSEDSLIIYGQLPGTAERDVRTALAFAKPTTSRWERFLDWIAGTD